MKQSQQNLQQTCLNAEAEVLLGLQDLAYLELFFSNHVPPNLNTSLSAYLQTVDEIHFSKKLCRQSQFQQFEAALHCSKSSAMLNSDSAPDHASDL